MSEDTSESGGGDDGSDRPRTIDDRSTGEEDGDSTRGKRTDGGGADESRSGSESGQAETSDAHEGAVDENSKQEQLDEVRENPEGEELTTDHGVKVSDTDNSLKATERGPTLMEDFHFREKMTQFDHESIPERTLRRRVESQSERFGGFMLHENSLWPALQRPPVGCSG